MKAFLPASFEITNNLHNLRPHLTLLLQIPEHIDPESVRDDLLSTGVIRVGIVKGDRCLCWNWYGLCLAPRIMPTDSEKPPQTRRVNKSSAISDEPLLLQTTTVGDSSKAKDQGSESDDVTRHTPIPPEIDGYKLALGLMKNFLVCTDQVDEKEISAAGSLGEFMEKLIIQAMLQRTGGNKFETARRIGMGRQTLYNKMQKYKLQEE